MALSANERKRRQLEREQAEKRASIDASYPYLEIPFHKFAGQDGNWMNIELSFDIMGLEAPLFEGDADPRSRSGEVDPETYRTFRGSIGVAEIMVEQLIDAATELSSMINRYKKAELSKRLADLEESLGVEQSRKDAVQEILRINRLLEQLDRNVRRTFPEWSLKGL